MDSSKLQLLSDKLTELGHVLEDIGTAKSDISTGVDEVLNSCGCYPLRESFDDIWYDLAIWAYKASSEIDIQIASEKVLSKIWSLDMADSDKKTVLDLVVEKFQKEYSM